MCGTGSPRRAAVKKKQDGQVSGSRAYRPCCCIWLFIRAVFSAKRSPRRVLVAMVLRTQRLRQPDSALVSDFEVKSLMHEVKQLSIRLPKICGSVSGLVLFGEGHVLAVERSSCEEGLVLGACEANRSHEAMVLDAGEMHRGSFSSEFRGKIAYVHELLDLALLKARLKLSLLSCVKAVGGRASGLVFEHASRSMG